MKLSVLGIDILLIQVSITDGRRVILHHKCISLFHGVHLENHPKSRVGPKISSDNILILNQGVQ